MVVVDGRLGTGPREDLEPGLSNRVFTDKKRFGGFEWLRGLAADLSGASCPEQRGLWNGRSRVLHDDEPTWCILSDRMQSGTLFDYARTIDGRPGMIPLED